MLDYSDGSESISLQRSVVFLRAAGEPTRMRLLALLCKSDLSVSDLREILGQSQPRISRHLRLLVEAGLAERYQEGAWAYFRSTDEGVAGDFNRFLVNHIDIDDTLLTRDAERLEAVRKKRAENAARYFSNNAASWDSLRSLHVSEKRVEEAMSELVGERQFGQMLDLGTGTGRVLELFSPLCQRAVGLDGSRDMLSYARANLEQAGVKNAQVRQGDIYQLPTPRNSYDLVTIHQVLHFLDDPALAVREAARALAPSGLMLIVDFAPHNLDFLREKYAHLRLGFSHEQVKEWLETAGLEVVEIRDVVPQSTDSNKLTVTLWLARDQRVLMAEQIAGQNQELVI
jgi:ArsR family transcriptional regulator